MQIQIESSLPSEVIYELETENTSQIEDFWNCNVFTKLLIKAGLTQPLNKYAPAHSECVSAGKKFPELSYDLQSFHNLQDMLHTASLVTKVFIQRDYSEGTVCRFQTKFPTELDNRIEKALLEQTVKTLNSYYVEAEKVGGQSYLEGCLACATAYIVFLCMETRYEKVLKKISGYIQEQNEKIYAPRGLLLTDPIERGMRV
ncbi:Golgin subfamily A member 7B, partial [Ilyodon furcidens]